MGGPPRVPRIPMPGWLAPLAARRVGPASVESPGSRRPGSAASPLSLGETAALFEDLRNANIPFDYPRNECFARAHAMRRLMDARGIESRKVWNFSRNFREPGGTHDERGRIREEGALFVEDSEMGTVLWTYHVAPTVVVDGPDGPVTMVLDPSICEGPVTIDEWRAAQGAPDSILEETEGGIYTPKDVRDDDYSRTDADLERARRSREAWEDGLVPHEDDVDRVDFADGLVPETSMQEE